MPDETDRFSGFGDTMGEESASDDETASTPARDGEGGDGDEHGDAHPAPFSFDETDLKSYYVREETFEPIGTMRSLVRMLATKQGLEDGELSQRELHDAELSVLQQRDDWMVDVATVVLERRGFDVDEAEVRELVEMLGDTQ